MITHHDVREACEWAGRVRAAGLSLGLVPTMGALHAGHEALIRQSVKQCDRTAVTIFVNPTQFGENEDLDRYPRSPGEDIELCRGLGVDLVLMGETSGAGSVYPSGAETWVTVDRLSRPLCGRYRPGHFRGVATVVTMLFCMFRPHRAYFGLKDFQQARLIERLAIDLHTGVDVRALPTVREADGLAMSSRNAYLSREERRQALAVPGALEIVEAAFRGGEQRIARLAALLESALRREPGLRIEYAEIRDAATLEEPARSLVGELDDGVVVAVAAHSGSTRLIDNVWLGPRTGAALEEHRE